MKLIDLNCPHCGALLKVDSASKQCTCEFCGAKLIIDDETIHVKYDNAEESGYQFEKGRQRAQTEAAQNQQVAYSYENQTKPKKKSRIWLWVIGWIFIFPVPLTILMLRNKKMKPALKYGIIAVAWILYLVIAFAGKSDKSTNQTAEMASSVSEVTETSEAPTLETTITPAAEADTETNAEETAETATQNTEETAEIATQNAEETAVTDEPADDSDETLTIEIVAGEPGEYGQALVLNEGTDMPDETIGYFVPSGTYEITNIGEYLTQANVYKNEKHVTEEGWEEWADGTAQVVDVDETIQMTVPDGYFFNCDEPAHFILKKIG